MAFGANETVELIDPTPAPAPQAEGAVAGVTEQVHVAPVKAAGNESVTAVPIAADNPVLETVTV